MRFISILSILLIFAAVCFIGPVSAAEYAIGDKITLSGTNPNSEYTYLYIQGVNVPLQEIPLADGGYLTTASDGIPVNEVNNRWETSFYLANRFDAGTYSIYASPVPFEYTGAHTVKKDDDQIQRIYTITLKGAYFAPTAAKTAEPLKTAAPVQTKAPEATPALHTVTAIHIPTGSETAKSPLPAWALIAGLGAAAVLCSKRR